MPKKNKDHLIINTFTGDMECRHCGQKQPVAYPINLTMFLGMMKIWEKMHRNCIKPLLDEEKATI